LRSLTARLPRIRSTFVRRAKQGASYPVNVRTFQSSNQAETTECCVYVSQVILLDDGVEDLKVGRRFYEDRGEGLGDHSSILF